MEFSATEIDDISRVVLAGRLDTTGVDRIETRFIATVVPPGRSTVIDLSAVDFISSMGLRLLIGTARSLAMKKARLVLFGAQPLVSESLRHAGIGDIIPILPDEAGAFALLRG
jgi:anti-sigma B factor antagonist